jgi:NACalpha-BTF3-like transcription factor
MSNQSGFGQTLAQAQQSGGSSLNALASSMGATSLGKGGDDDDDEMPELEPADDAPKADGDDDEDDGDVSDGDVDPKEVELVMNQTSCSRKKAIKALKDSGGDIINASKSTFALALRVSFYYDQCTDNSDQLWPQLSRTYDSLLDLELKYMASYITLAPDFSIPGTFELRPP